MGTQIFLGMPPANIEQWMKKHHTKLETHIKFVDGTEDDYLIEGVMDCPKLIEAGLMPEGSGTEEDPSWITQPLEVNIGSAVTSIGFQVFFRCDLTSVIIPDSVTSIGDGAFDGCENLASMTIGNNVTSIGMWVFYNCASLTSMTIPNSVTSIGESAFDSCSGLESMTIPNRVTSIGYRAFCNCSKLKSVTFSGKDKATVQGMSDYSWDLPSDCIIHCTDGDITI